MIRFAHMALCAAVLAACTEREVPVDTYRNLTEEVKYVGKEACRTCHPDKYATFVEAQMGRSFRPAVLTESDARWEDVRPVYDPNNDLYYRPFHRGANLFIMEYRLANGDTVHKRIGQIDYIVGSGQHTNSHIMSVNGYLYQMPMTWYTQDGKWSLPPKYDSFNYRFSRPIPQACMACHNAVSGFDEQSENRFTNVPHGIDCERCHGPGELHVSEKMEGKIVDISKETDFSIVNPARLPLERQFDVCQRCHMQGATVYKDGKSPFDFRPGMNLTEVMNVFWPRYSDSTQNFIMASHPDRLKMSECFVESHREDSRLAPMTCTTCHDPHLPIEALGADHYRAVCRSCHEPSEAHAPPAECTAPEPLRLAKNDDCVACHMPVSGSSDIPHVRITDHFIRVTDTLSVEQVEAQKQFIGLASLIEKNPTDREMADGYMAYYEEISDVPYFLDSAAVRLQKALRDESLAAVMPSLVRVRYLQNDYNAIVALSRRLDRSEISDPWTFYRIGEAFSKVGDPQKSLQYLEEAVRLNPRHLRFLNRLGMEYVTAQRLEKAVETFDRLISEHPEYGESYNNRGFARAMLGDMAGAEADLRRAIELDPDSYQAIGNLASLYLNTNRIAEARPYAKRLLDSDPTNAEYRRLWNYVN